MFFCTFTQIYDTEHSEPMHLHTINNVGFSNHTVLMGFSKLSLNFKGRGVKPKLKKFFKFHPTVLD